MVIRLLLNVVIASLITMTTFGMANSVQFNNKLLNQAPVALPKLKNIQLVMPTLNQLKPASCLKPGESITLIGRNFGSKNQQGIAIVGDGLHLDLTSTYWSMDKIIVRLPNSNRLTEGTEYLLGFEKKNHGQWLNNRALPVLICKPAVNRTKQPQRLHVKPGQDAVFFAEPDDYPSATDPEEPDPSEAYSEEWYPEGSSYQEEVSFVPSSGGSLLSSGMPAPPTPPPLSPDEESDSIEPSEVIILSPDMAHAKTVANELANANITVKRRRKLKSLGLVISTFRLPAGEKVSEHLKQLRSNNEELWVEANHRYQLQSASQPNTRWEYQSIGWKIAKSCGKGVRIGLIDTPINITHEALGTSKITTRSFLSRGVATASADHGTAIASQLMGLMPEAALFAAEVFKQRDKKHIETTAELLILSLDWLVEQQVSVINLSLGGSRNLLFETVLKRVMALGISTVAAVGNNGVKASKVYPAAQPGVIAVTALDAASEGYAHANQGDYVDFAAPGVDVAVAKAAGGMIYRSGTSHAVPFVTAALANIRDHYKGDLQQYYVRLKRSAKDLGVAGRDARFGWGLINVKETCGLVLLSPIE
ncbi:hypothetical protein MNBD_GAMMA26-1185 [hydrothermal vent metagenome]|uniref:Peptidase S8/S53 domain-containing protein n=1 Tax=hydrothermal vent metagenome TaxID=652676 RepID=A0A3B1AUM8_9ZZZZ